MPPVPDTEEPFVLPGVLWAVGRLAPVFPAETGEVVPEIAARCGWDDPRVRAHAAFALGAVGDPRARAALEAITDDERPARVYLGDQLVTKEVREWAGEALSGLRAA